VVDLDKPARSEAHNVSTSRFWAKVIFINGCFLLFGTLVVETFFGSWVFRDRIQQIGVSQDLELEYDVSTLYVTDQPSIHAYWDKYGLRGHCGSPENISILAVGGSTTMDFFVTDGRTWTDVLTSALRTTVGHHNICVANSGVSGQSTIGHILNFKLWYPFIPNLKPKFVLFYVGLNDLARPIEQAIRQNDEPTAEQSHTWIENVFRYFVPWNSKDSDIDLKCITFACDYMNRSPLYRMYKIIKGTLAARSLKIGHGKIDPRQTVWTTTGLLSGNYAEFASVGLKAYETRLLQLASFTKDMGAVPVFISQKSMEYRQLSSGAIEGTSEQVDFANQKINGVDKFYLAELVAKQTMTACRISQGICINLFADLNLDPSDLFDNFHATDVGAKKIGIFLAERLSGYIKAPLLK
jgi:hypothetical protein